MTLYIVKIGVAIHPAWIQHTNVANRSFRNNSVLRYLTICNKSTLPDHFMNKPLPDLLDSIADLLLDVVFVIDRDGVIVHVSAGCEEMFGFRPDEMIGRRQFEFLAPEDREASEAEGKLVLSGQRRVGFQNRYLHKDGHRLHIMWSARLLPEEGLRVGVARNVSGLKLAEQRQAVTYEVTAAAHRSTELSELCVQLHDIIGQLVRVDGIAIVADGVGERGEAAIYFSPVDAALQDRVRERLRHWPRASDRGGVPVLVHVPVDDHVETWQALSLTGQRGTNGALFLRDRSGANCTAADAELFRFVAAQVAIAVERQQLHSELLRAARYDDLTGLPNRRLFHDRLRIALARARRTDKRMALLFVDIDHFKEVNDTLGHGVGDRLLQEVAERLAQCARRSDTVARIGGDEFVVLAEELARSEDAQLIADKIHAAVGAPLVVGEHTLNVSASVGIALFPDHGEQADQLLRLADSAMYEEKQRKNIVAG
jgi:diguanylate cyclase (GGDEF)-like protein/PAS domain S-box-containing protein